LVVEQLVLPKPAPSCEQLALGTHQQGWIKGDMVMVGGHAGIVVWDGRPKHNYASVRWQESGEESNVIQADDVTLLGSKSQANQDYECLSDVDSTAASSMSVPVASPALVGKADQSKAAPCARLQLTATEERDAKKFEKTLRDIAKLEHRLANGEKLDQLQLDKISRRKGLESETVMIKLQAGYARHDAQ